MTMTDPVADLLTHIRNAARVGKDRCDVPASRLKLEFAKILQEEGFVRSFKVLEEGHGGTIRLYLRYSPDGEPAIHGLDRISRPGLRVYRGVDRPALGALGASALPSSRPPRAS